MDTQEKAARSARQINAAYFSLGVTINEFFEVFIVIARKLPDDVADALIERLPGFILIKGPEEDMIFVLPHF